MRNGPWIDLTFLRTMPGLLFWFDMEMTTAEQRRLCCGAVSVFVMMKAQKRLPLGKSPLQGALAPKRWVVDIQPAC